MSDNYTAGNTNFSGGAYALYSNKTGHDNVALGPYALNCNAGGSNSVAVGPDALRYATEGDSNTAIGDDAGRYIADGETANETSSESVYLGSRTMASDDGVTNEIIIGAGAVGGGSNTARIGNEDITAWLPGDDGTVSLGSESAAFKELYLGDGTGVTRSLRALVADIDALSVKRYGVRFGGSANTGVTVARLYDAVGMVANPSTDAAIAVNNFDDIYPWSGMRPCCGDYDANGNMVVNAWYGDPTFKRDGTNGNVWVYVPEFWWSWTTTAGVEDIIVSPSEIAGYVHSPARYIAAYKMSKTAGNLAASVSGVFSEYGSLVSSMALARTLGSRYCVGQIAEWVELGILFAVEYATRNTQAIMTGYASGVFSAACKATTQGTDQFISTSTLCSGFLVGQVVGVGTAEGNSSIANNATIEAIALSAGTYTIDLDTTGITIPVDAVLWNLPYKTGVTDGVLGPSGSPVSNADNKHVCRYRYIEDPWGSAYEDVCDVACVRTGTDPNYVYTPWYLPDAAKWTNGSVTADYVQLGYAMPVADNYITAFGVDADYPAARLPSVASAGSTTYWSDRYCYPRSALTSVRRGGVLYNGDSAGLFYLYCNLTASNSVWNFRARLSYKAG